MDNLGRVTVPMEMRASLNIKPGDPIDIARVRGGILLSPLSASCGICGSTEDLLEIDGMGICRECALEIKGGAGEEIWGGLTRITYPQRTYPTALISHTQYPVPPPGGAFKARKEKGGGWSAARLRGI
jgi:transcriptional pleiotropic regulator of transition state genes